MGVQTIIIMESKFNTLGELENNVLAKNIKEEAKIFYQDKTKDFVERENVFIKYCNNVYDYIPRFYGMLSYYFDESRDYMDRNQLIDLQEFAWQRAYNHTTDEDLDKIKSMYSEKFTESKEKLQEEIENKKTKVEEEDFEVEALYRAMMEEVFEMDNASFKYDW